MNNRYIQLGLFAAVLMSACSSTPDEPKSRGTSHVDEASSLSGYVHTFERSRFILGEANESPTYLTEFGISKVVGAWGVFGVKDTTGISLGSPNGDAPSKAAAPLLGPEAHNTEVQAYFVAAGIPSEQILEVQPMASMIASVDESNTPVNSTLDRYYSYVTRHFQGIQIMDSFAWATLDEDGKAVHESVYWPGIPSSALASATSFQAKLADEQWRSAFEASLPSGGNGRLVIRHTSGMYDGTFVAVATYDVKVGSNIVHFDDTAHVVKLPDEIEGAYGPSEEE